jgi:hypothetical protein
LRCEIKHSDRFNYGFPGQTPSQNAESRRDGDGDHRAYGEANPPVVDIASHKHTGKVSKNH